MIVKVRKVGNSKTLTIPKAFDVSDDTNFTVTYRDDGSIIYTPERRNPFEGNWFKEDLSQDDVTKGIKLMDSEWS